VYEFVNDRIQPCVLDNLGFVAGSYVAVAGGSFRIGCSCGAVGTVEWDRRGCIVQNWVFLFRSGFGVFAVYFINGFLCIWFTFLGMFLMYITARFLCLSFVGISCGADVSLGSFDRSFLFEPSIQVQIINHHHLQPTSGQDVS